MILYHTAWLSDDSESYQKEVHTNSFIINQYYQDDGSLRVEFAIPAEVVQEWREWAGDFECESE